MARRVKRQRQRAPRPIKEGDKKKGGPGVVASTIVISACAKPPAFELALKLLDAHPTMALDAAAVAPLLADNNKKLQALVLEEEPDCRQLADALLTETCESGTKIVTQGHPVSCTRICKQGVQDSVKEKEMG